MQNIKKINIILFSILLSMGMNFTVVGMFSTKFVPSVKNFSKIHKNTGASQFSDIKNSMPSISTCGVHPVDDFVYNHISEFGSIFENTDVNIIQDFFKTFFASSSLSENLKPVADTFAKQLEELSDEQKELFLKKALNKGKDVVQKGVQFVKEHPYTTGLVMGGIAYYAAYKIRTTKTCKKIDETRKSFNKQIKKGNRKIRKIENNINATTTNTNDIKTSLIELNNCYNEIIKDQKNIKNTIKKEGREILTKLEDQDNCIDNINKTTQESKELTAEYVQATYNMQNSMRDTKHILEGLGMNNKNNILDKLKQDNEGLTNANNVIKRLLQTIE